MKTLLLILMIPALALAQYWPTSAATPEQLLIAGNNVQAVVVTPLTNTATVLTISGSNPFLAGMVLTFSDNTGEQVYVSSVAGATINVIRGYGGTTAVSHVGTVSLKNLISSSYHNTLGTELSTLETSLFTNVLPYYGYFPNWVTALGSSGNLTLTTDVTGTGTSGSIPATVVQQHPTAYTVAGLPTASSNTGLVVLVNNGANSADCTVGGGSSLVWCRSNGTAYISVGGFTPGTVSITGDGTGSGTSSIPLTVVAQHPTTYTIATLPTASANSGLVVPVTDSSTGDCTTGGGSLQVWCRSNGTAWSRIGVGASSVTLTGDTTGTGTGTIATTTGNIHPVTYTVATLPAASSNSGLATVVTDGASSSDCTVGGGSSLAWCRSNGTAWSAVGGGGGGGGSSWSALTNPTANLSLDTGAYTSTFTASASAGTSDVWRYYSSNAGTGFLFNIWASDGVYGTSRGIFRVSEGSSQTCELCIYGNTNSTTRGSTVSIQGNNVAGSTAYLQMGITTAAGCLAFEQPGFAASAINCAITFAGKDPNYNNSPVLAVGNWNGGITAGANLAMIQNAGTYAEANTVALKFYHYSSTTPGVIDFDKYQWIGSSQANNYMYFSTKSTTNSALERLRITSNVATANIYTSNANFGVGDSSPSALFSVGSTHGFTVDNSGNATAVHDKISPACTTTTCAGDTAGAVAITAGSTTVSVSTTAIASSSLIFLTVDSGLSTQLGVTCDNTVQAAVGASRVVGTSFNITVGTPGASNPVCVSWHIIN